MPAAPNLSSRTPGEGSWTPKTEAFKELRRRVPFDAHGVEVVVVGPHAGPQMERKRQDVDIVRISWSDPAACLVQRLGIVLSVNNDDRKRRDGEEHGVERQLHLAGERRGVGPHLRNRAGGRHDIYEVWAREDQRGTTASCR